MTPGVFRRLYEHGLVAVLVIDDAAIAPDIGHALKAGGLPIVEVTLRTSEAERALTLLASDSDLLVGAGTVLSAEQVDRAADAGAQFIVSPGVSADVVQAAQRRGLPVVPGVASATEIMAALRLGVDVVKLFPAEQLGGAATLRALSAPFPGLRFIPTGGIGAAQLESYLALPSVLAVGGSWLVTAASVQRRDWAEITALTAAASTTAGRVRPECIRS